MCVSYKYLFLYSFFFFKQKTAYEMRISDWSSDVCSSDLPMPTTMKRSPARWWIWARSTPAPSSAGSCPPMCPRIRSPRSRTWPRDRKSVVWGKSVSVRVDIGGRRILKKKKKSNNNTLHSINQYTTDTLNNHYKETT